MNMALTRTEDKHAPLGVTWHDPDEDVATYLVIHTNEDEAVGFIL